MEIIEATKSNIGMLLLTVIGGAGIISIAIAAWLMMMAHGDPQQMAKARNAFFGGVVGLILGGFAFAIPEILSDTVVQPSGGRGFGIEEAGSCDEVLRRELVLQANANTTARMQQVVRVIQVREEDCLSDNWDPEVVSGAPIPNPKGWNILGSRGRCFAELPDASGYTVDGVNVPSEMLRDEGNVSNTDILRVPSSDSVRSVNDNILIYFGDGDQRPTDLSRCWMYLNRDQLWLGAG